MGCCQAAGCVSTHLPRSLPGHGPLRPLAAALQALRLPCPHGDRLLGRRQPLVRHCPALAPLQQRRPQW